MQIDDLEKFLVIAEREHLQRAALELETSASALSKAIKRLEQQLSAPLFDRVGKRIALNDTGRLLVPQAAQLVAQAKQVKLSILANSANQVIRIAGPAILQFRWSAIFTRHFKQALAHAQLHFDCQFEQSALESVVKGTSDMALITDVLSAQIPQTLHRKKLGPLTMQVAAAKHHPLVDGSQGKTVTKSFEQVRAYPFAAPNVSPYCGENRGVGCDGWDNQGRPRKVQYVVNDISVLSQLVRSGQALGFLPDYWLREWQLSTIEISDFPYHYQENVLLVARDKKLLDMCMPA